MNAIFEPSGDHAGARLDFLAFVSWRTAGFDVSASQNSVSYALSSQFVSRTVYATQRPSGEIWGEPTRFSDRIWSAVGATVGAAICARTGAATAAAAQAIINVFFIVSPLESPSPRFSVPE